MTELPIVLRGKATLYQLMSNMLIHGGKYLWFFHSMIAWPKSLACSVNLIGKTVCFNKLSVVLKMSFILMGSMLSLKTQQLLDRPCSGINSLVASFVSRLRVGHFVLCMPLAYRLKIFAILN